MYEFPDTVREWPKARKESCSSATSPIEELIEDIRVGRPVVLANSSDSVSTGDIVVPAQFATAENINFMAKHGCGLICLAISAQRAGQLNLKPMVSGNRARVGAAFTVSIEAREGVTTGISAADRARTIAVAIDPDKGPHALVSPGHVFPLVARDGGVLVHQGRTEAAVDISRIAGHDASGVICEVMCDDGSVARMPGLVAFARKHGLKIGTIGDLAAYRRRTECKVYRILDCSFDSTYGNDIRLLIYRNILNLSEYVVLARGRIEPNSPTIVRIHQLDLENDVISPAHLPQELIPRTISEYDGAGVHIFVRDSTPARLQNRCAGSARPLPAERMAACEGAGEILRDLQVGKIVLIVSNNFQLVGLDSYEDSIVERRSTGVGVNWAKDK